MTKKVDDNRELLMLYKTRTTGKYVKDFRCPFCGHGTTDYPRAKLHGWCETPQGLQMIFRCPRCATLYRYHGTTTARWNLDEFLENVWLELVLGGQIDKNDGTRQDKDM